jgi:fatty acid CoA ligase FadD9
LNRVSAGGIAVDGVVTRDVEVHLLDVPELGYLSSDKPYPRGEICVHTDVMIEGYFKNPAKTEEAFVVVDGKRFFRTGDIGFRRMDHQVKLNYYYYHNF